MSDTVKRLRDSIVRQELEPPATLLVHRAESNLAKWGEQDYETLALAVAEEAGELAQAVLHYRHENGAQIRINAEAIDLGALCLQVIRHFDHEMGLT